jgi:hypothetical protein
MTVPYLSRLAGLTQGLLPRALLLFAVAVLWGCGDDTATDPEPSPELARIEVEPGESALSAIGQELVFTAKGRTSSGDLIPGLAFDWSTSDPQVATVDAQGRVTATGFGNTSITAELDRITGSATLLVRECTETLDLAPGEGRILEVPGPADCGIILPAGAAGDRYRIAVVRTVGDPCESGGVACNDDITVQVQLRPTAAAAAAAPGALLRGSGSSAGAEGILGRGPRIAVPAHLAEARRIADRTAEAHVRRREAERRMLARLAAEGPLHEALVRPPTDRVLAPGLAPAPAPALPGRLVIDSSTDPQCTTGDPLVVHKVFESDALTFYQDSAQIANPQRAVNAEQLRRMSEFYESWGAPVIDSYFGGISDLDGNGRVIVVVSSMVPSGTAAFVWSGDFFATDRCAASNEGEYIYFSPTVVRNQDSGNWQSLETLVHEMKHVSSLKKSIDRSEAQPGLSSVYHPSWIEEGTAEIASYTATRFAWYDQGGPAPNERADAESMRATGFVSVGGETQILPEFYGMALRLLRTQGYLSSQPNGLTHNPAGAGSSHSVYGSGFHFHRWLGDAFGGAATLPGGDAAFFQEQNAATTPPGLAGLSALTGRSFEQLVARYALAVMRNDDTFELARTPEALTSIDFASAGELFCFALSQGEYDALVAGLEPGAEAPCTDENGNFDPSGPDGRYPWPVTAQSDGTNAIPFRSGAFAGQAGNGGLRIHDFLSEGTHGAEIQIEARRADQARVVVTRVR